MYRVFCESYHNYINQYFDCINENEYRFVIARPLELLSDLKKYRIEEEKLSQTYKEVNDLLVYMQGCLEKYPKLKAFLWTLESRGIKGRCFGITPATDLEEQAKLVNTFLNLLYWDNKLPQH